MGGGDGGGGGGGGRGGGGDGWGDGGGDDGNGGCGLFAKFSQRQAISPPVVVSAPVSCWATPFGRSSPAPQFG